MAYYRTSELDLSTRTALAIEMLQPLPAREWGRATELARRYHVSRQWRYQLRERALDALRESLTPRQPGSQPRAQPLCIDQEHAIAVLPLLKGTVRDIQQGLHGWFGVHRSLGYISETLTAIGQQAEARNRGLAVPLPILGEADEIFQGQQPCLTLVDGRSFLVLNLTPAQSRDGTSWGVTYLDLVERGIQFHDLACDGGTGLRAGVKEAELAIPLRPDLFHILQAAHRLTRHLEGAAYQAMENTERAQRAELEAQGRIRRRGRRLKIQVPLPQAQRTETAAIALFDNWCWLLQEIRQALEPLTPAGDIVSCAAAQATLETAVALLQELGCVAISAFANDIQEKIPALLAPLAWLEQQLKPILAVLEEDTAAFIIWAWQQRHALALDPAVDFPEQLCAVACTVWQTLELFHRSSSLAESLHSWLRPYLQIHRGMPQWLLPLLQLFWNHHTFERGKRAGNSPVELAGVENALPLMEVWAQLLEPRSIAQPA
ncbi:MAG TPA: hypothetical protein PKH77_00720 [Anaerolineae bacterium]|nr:hypothetical protein [Anaerolineae bacterium]